jgi:signal transduction histidine kinase
MAGPPRLPAAQGHATALPLGGLDSRLLLAVGRLDPRFRYVAATVFVALLYFGSALAGNAVRLTGNVDAVWPPVGIGIAALYLGGMRLLPAVLLGDLLADLPGHLPVAPSLGQTTGNMLEVIVATLLLRRLLRGGSPFDRPGTIVRVFGALAVGTLISATVGAASLRLGGVISLDELPAVWRTWFLGDSCGAIVIVPLALAWHDATRAREERRWQLEPVLLIALVALLAEVVLRTNVDRDLMYVLLPLLIWVASRVGARGATFAVALVVALTVEETAQRRGPFVMHSIPREVLTTQLFIATAALSTFVFAAMVAERQQFAEQLTVSRRRVLAAAEAERKRLGRNLHDGAQQRLSAVAAMLDGLDGTSGGHPNVSPMSSSLQSASEQVGLAIDELRGLAHGLHPPVLTDFGLQEAIENMAARSSIPVRLRVSLPPARLGDLAESTGYYVIAEALANAQQHSRATCVEIGASVSGGRLRFHVSDDGRGSAHAYPGSGLEGLCDRVETVGGTFAIESVAGRGTVVSATVPVSLD